MSSLQTSTIMDLTEHGPIKRKKKKNISTVAKVVLKPEASVGITSVFKYRHTQLDRPHK